MKALDLEYGSDEYNTIVQVKSVILSVPSYHPAATYGDMVLEAPTTLTIRLSNGASIGSGRNPISSLRMSAVKPF